MIDRGLVSAWASSRRRSPLYSLSRREFSRTLRRCRVPAGNPSPSAMIPMTCTLSLLKRPVEHPEPDRRAVEPRALAVGRGASA